MSTATHSATDYAIRIVGSGEAIEKANLVQFHLLYTGPLHSSGSVAEKLSIRRVLHQQIARLWSTNHSLTKLAQQLGSLAYAQENERAEIQDAPDISAEDALQYGFRAMGRNWSRHGWDYVPLVVEDFCLRCRLHILFLRVDEKRNYVLQGGDIDGRLKTLFDALRIAREKNELPNGAVQGSDETPLFVLLENDDLVSEINISTDRLLLLPEAKRITPDPHDVYLQITVQLNPAQQTRYAWAF